MTHPVGHRNPQHRIYTEQGRTAGFVSGSYFNKKLDSVKHVFRVPYRRIAFDIGTLHGAKALGATHVRISFIDIADVLSAPIDDILNKGREEPNRRFGKQISLAWSSFDNATHSASEPQERQATLFEEMG